MIVAQCSTGKVRSCNQIQIEWKKKCYRRTSSQQKFTMCAEIYLNCESLTIWIFYAISNLQYKYPEMYTWNRFAKISEFNVDYGIKKQDCLFIFLRLLHLLKRSWKHGYRFSFMILLVLCRKPSWLKFNDLFSIFLLSLLPHSKRFHS